MFDPKGDDIAECVLQTFSALPAKCKPRVLRPHRREWAPLAGIVLSRDNGGTSTLTCVALATGMKCLSMSKLPLANGNVLHDWHAEILAIRLFNRFLVDECEYVARKGGRESIWVERRAKESALTDGEATNSAPRSDEKKPGSAMEAPWQDQPFALRDDVRIHMYCSEAPCGDASMELTMAQQDDDTPWEKEEAAGVGGLLGRGNFDQLGIVRRKPSRPDAPPSLSKSCSDKLAMKQCTGLLSGPASLLLYPGNIYISIMVLPESQYVESAAQRAFESRMSRIATDEVQLKWQRSGFAFRTFQMQTTAKEFSFTRRAVNMETATVPSNLSAAWTPRRQEVLINGVLQGRKQLDARGASCVSRRSMWASILSVAMLAGLPALTQTLKSPSYNDLKQSARLAARENLKSDVRKLALEGWKKNEGDGAWALDRADD